MKARNRDSAVHPPVTLPGTEFRLLDSSVVGDRYRVQVAPPPNYPAPKAAYPVIYVADGQELFPLVRFIAASLSGGLEMPRSIVVGIGPDVDSHSELGRYRERDLLPTDASAGDPARRQPFTRTGIPRGKAGAFLRFIREELKPFIDANYRTDPDDCAYVGISYGGLFGLYTLFHRPDTFSRYVIGSPALHHDDRVALAYEGEYAAAHDDLPVRVFLSVGAREEGSDPLIPASFQFVTNVRTLDRTLRARSYPGLRLTTHIFEEESHVSVVPATLSRGLRAVFG